LLRRDPASLSAPARGCSTAASPCILTTPYGNATEMFFEQVLCFIVCAEP
jgi:hypothetical protein